MVSVSVAAAAAAAANKHNPASSSLGSSPPSSRRPLLRPPNRLRSSGSFHAGAPFPQLSPYDDDGRRRKSSTGGGSTHKYHTFPTAPPKTASGGSGGHAHGHEDGNGHEHERGSTPLPWKQLGLLALVSLAEQTALNSISPYLPTMVSSFPEIPAGHAGAYVGLLASAFALAQLATNLLWGYLSDTVGRKPVMLLGTSLLGLCFGAFGFCRGYGQLVGVHVAMGLLNGNAAVVPTCLGEVTDRSNQSRAFIWLPVMYSIGGITGPAMGGLLVRDVGDGAYPFLAPNIVSAALLFASVVVLAVWFDETLDGVDRKARVAGLGWVERVFEWRCLRCLQRRGRGERQSASSRWLAGSRDTGDESTPSSSSGSSDGSTENEGLLQSQPLTPTHSDDDDPADGNKMGSEQKSAFRELANRTTLAVLVTYLFFQLSNISYNSLYPIFASAPPPTGRGLGPETIGLSLSFAGLATILFQLTLFRPLKARVGNLGTYRASLLGIALSMALMPFVGHSDEKPWFRVGSGRAWLYAELGVVLLLKNVCAVGGLSSVMLLVSSIYLPRRSSGRFP